jgi:hypothetical protein
MGWLGTAVVVGIGSMVGMIAMASRGEILGLGGAIAGSVGLYGVMGRGRGSGVRMA